MKRLLSIRTLALMMALSAAVAAHSYTLTNETLHYDIVYHWGLIWKHAGSATLSIKKSGHNYDASLSARTISWADKVFRVRDTLSCSIQPSGMRPIVYRKASHEGKHSGIDIVRYSYNGIQASPNAPAYAREKQTTWCGCRQTARLTIC